jgi:hypothetical protein
MQMCKQIKLPAYMNDQTTNQSCVVCSSEVKQAVSTKEGRDVAQKSPTAARPWGLKWLLGCGYVWGREA